MNRAYFVQYPRTYEDLLELHILDHEQPYEITCTVELGPIDYENFIFGLDADRQYIENYAHLCSDGAIKKCLLIRKRMKQEGILVVPEPKNPSFVLYAAYFKGE